VARDYYRILGVSPDASAEEIERSFRQLARRLHPDLNGGDGATQEMMKELNVARAALTDVTARAAYDDRLRREKQAEPRRADAAPPRPGPPAVPPQVRLRTAVPSPVSSWARPRTASPPPPTRELRSASHVWRLLWIAFAAFMALLVVVFLIWLRGTFAE
jgi:curved DNA-binding protein CbpA